MSTEIHGWIEVHLPILSEWAAITNIGLIVGQSYNAYACLFGVRNVSNFVPIAEMRGLPPNVSDAVRMATKDLEDLNSPSWVAYNEIEKIDWKESVVDAYVHVYEKLKTGEYAHTYSAGYIPKEPLHHGLGDVWYANGNEAKIYRNGELHKIERISRRDALRPFQVAFDIMAILANQNGSENVRLVVWFD